MEKNMKRKKKVKKKIPENIEVWVPLRPSESESLIEGPRNLHPRWLWHPLQCLGLNRRTGPAPHGDPIPDFLNQSLPLTHSPTWFFMPSPFEKSWPNALRTTYPRGFFFCQVLRGERETQVTWHSSEAQVKQAGAQRSYHGCPLQDSREGVSVCNLQDWHL